LERHVHRLLIRQSAVRQRDPIEQIADPLPDPDAVGAAGGPVDQPVSITP
jgi:hypothetical protein